MKIEILLSTYNGEKYIKEQLNSVLRQSYNDFEILIRDDGSRDGTINIIKKMMKSDSRIKLLEDNYGNLGVRKSFEELLKKSSADLVMFCDQDDVWVESKIDIFYKKYKTLPDKNKCILIHSDLFVTDKELNIITISQKEKPNEKGINRWAFDYCVQGASSMVNRKLIEFAVPFIEEAFIHDRYLHLLAEIYGERYYINKPLLYYRQHENNVIGSERRILKKIVLNLNLLKNKFYREEDKNILEGILKKKYNKELGELLEIFQKKGRWEKILFIRKNSIHLSLKRKIQLMING